jgi:C4-dicarboxylate-specific signal transduction histidine kinase
MTKPVILYVDDEEINISNFVMFFEQEFEILTAGNGREALDLFTSRQDLAVVITDQRMPGMTGVKLLSEIYRINPDPIRVILTAYADVQDITAAINLGHIYQYVQKPWAYDKLHLILLQAADKYRLVRENKQLLVELDRKNQLLTAANERLAADLALQQQLELQRREAEVKMLSQAKLASLGEIATGIAHEINQPLTYIQIILQATGRDIEQGTLDLNELAADLQESTRQVGRITRIIEHLRTFGRVDSAELTDLSLPSILNNTLILYREILRINSIHLEMRAEADLPLIYGDATQLEQVFINLLQNAIDAVSGTENPTIEVCFSHRNGTVVTTFSDTGCGLSKEVATKIFEPFFTTKPIGKGTGLGLSIVYGIIADHNGTIECQSNAGQGCRFVITLPAA